ncbi:hypothetical protein N7462_002429 [Penicillium macrosclerotiorum]|uniref:uncharacterized protein n=1 Tax=Penicillium macrosclerotiorum TaxID=303699 RepID=UPI0025484388|nr:uncharacterized protein N7462_002429 [Penicillium macrosclerotiorum]KAJ5693006.1 hypothetical protein N7462_002429 [Penicillium macrosclerotiorum]
MVLMRSFRGHVIGPEGGERRGAWDLVRAHFETAIDGAVEARGWVPYCARGDVRRISEDRRKGFRGAVLAQSLPRVISMSPQWTEQQGGGSPRAGQDLRFGKPAVLVHEVRWIACLASGMESGEPVVREDARMRGRADGEWMEGRGRRGAGRMEFSGRVGLSRGTRTKRQARTGFSRTLVSCTSLSGSLGRWVVWPFGRLVGFPPRAVPPVAPGTSKPHGAAGKITSLSAPADGSSPPSPQRMREEPSFGPAAAPCGLWG